MNFVAENDLEEKLIKAQNGEISGEVFLKDMLEMQMFMPIKEEDEIAGFQRTQSATPLNIEDDEGESYIVLFTSPERSKEFIKDYPGFGGGLLSEFSWIIEKIGAGVGVIINPGFEVGLELEAETLNMLSQQ